MDMTELRTLVRAHQRARNGSARKIRQGAGLTLGQVADIIGVAESSVSRWEGGSRKPRGQHALRWAALLDELENTTEPADAA